MSKSTRSPSVPLDRIGDRVYEEMPKISSELFAITYGALVHQILIINSEQIEAVNHQLEQMGSKIGMRLIEEYVAKAIYGKGCNNNNNSKAGGCVAAPTCKSFGQTGEAIAKIGLMMFLGIKGQVANITGGGISHDIINDNNNNNNNNTSQSVQSYSIIFPDNPLNTFVELPINMRDSIWYSNILCGVIRGALEQVGIYTNVQYIRDILRGDDTNEIRVSLKGVTRDSDTYDTNRNK
eukprot:Tbor_TRINITY_DN5954_c5_g1::TRINITY_DN5954_c5_g1_i2::g.19323::m.19323/K20302/TRAPPC3, BET3; trafficking protein particle complex subunit 3